MAWHTLAAEAEVPGLAPLITLVQGSLSAVNAALNVVKASYTLQKTFVVDRVDVLQAVLEEVRTELAGMIEGLEESGIYYTAHVPRTPATAVGPTAWLTQVAASMVDSSDANRPNLVTPQAVTLVVIMVTLPDFVEMTAGAGAICTAFARPANVRPGAWSQAEIESTWMQNWAYGRGVAPDWGSTKFSALVPSMGDLASALRKAMGTLSYGVGATQLIDGYIAFVDSKIALVNALQDELEAVVTAFELLADLPPAHVLVVSGMHTTTSLKEALLAEGLPSDVAPGTLGAPGLLAGGAALLLVDADPVAQGILLAMVGGA